MDAFTLYQILAIKTIWPNAIMRKGERYIDCSLLETIVSIVIQYQQCIQNDSH